MTPCARPVRVNTDANNDIPFERFPLELPVVKALAEVLVNRVWVCAHETSHKVQVAISDSPEQLDSPRLVLAAVGHKSHMRPPHDLRWATAKGHREARWRNIY